MNLEMVPVEILGLKVNMQAVIHTLRQLGCMHIEELTDVPEVSACLLMLDRDTLRQHEELSFLVTRLGGLLSAQIGEAFSGTQTRDRQAQGGGLCLPKKTTAHRSRKISMLF